MSNDQSQAFTQTRDQVRKRQTEELSKKILSSINNTFVGDETRAWLSNVNENVDTSKTAAVDDHLCQLTMVELMDKLFDDFYRYSYQFNQTEDSKDFVIICHRPAANSQEEPGNLFQGSLQNNAWGMLVTGDSKSVRLSFVKPDRISADKTVHAEGTVCLELIQHPHPDGPPKLLWTADGKPVKLPQLPYLSKKIFARLIRVSRGEVGATERLSFDTVVVDSSPSDSSSEEDSEPMNNVDLITYSLISILEAIDTEVDAMQHEGMNALKKGGMDAVAPIVKRTQQLRTFRDKTAALAKEWSDLI